MVAGHPRVHPALILAIFVMRYRFAVHSANMIISQHFLLHKPPFRWLAPPPHPPELIWDCSRSLFYVSNIVCDVRTLRHCKQWEFPRAVWAWRNCWRVVMNVGKVTRLLWWYRERHHVVRVPGDTANSMMWWYSAWWYSEQHDVVIECLVIVYSITQSRTVTQLY